MVRRGKFAKLRTSLNESIDEKIDLKHVVEKGCCPVPMVNCCCKGEPLPKDGEDGVRMFCSNKECPISVQPLHKVCFDELEAGLIKILQSKGSARRWTEDQRLNNLWTKKGMSILARYLRCKCTKGILDKRFDFRMPDKSSLYDVCCIKTDTSKENSEKEAKHKKKRDLPVLNTGPRSTVTSRLAANIAPRKSTRVTPHFLADHSDDELPAQGSPSLTNTTANSSMTSLSPPTAKLSWCEKKEKPKEASPTDWPWLEKKASTAEVPSTPTAPPKSDPLKPRKTFSEVTQQPSPKPPPKKPDQPVYKVLNKVEVSHKEPVQSKPRKPSETKSEFRKYVSESKSHSETEKKKEKKKTPNRWEAGLTFKDKEKKTGDIKEKIKEIKEKVKLEQKEKEKAKNNVNNENVEKVKQCEKCVKLAEHTSVCPSSSSSSPTCSDVSVQTDETQFAPYSLFDSYIQSHQQILDSLTTYHYNQFHVSNGRNIMEYDKFDLGPAYKTNEQFIDSLISDSSDPLITPFLEDYGCSRNNHSIWTPSENELLF